MIFLYDAHGAPQKYDKSGHAGLWFERFFDRYNPDGSIPKESGPDKKNPKQAWLLDNFPNGKTVGNPEALCNYSLRQWRLSESLGGDRQVFKSDWHFVTGMGNPHPVENGFSWHPVLGVPYLTGAAVKGLLRSYLEAWEGADGDKLRQWFGSADKSKRSDQDQAGSLIFFDAVPVAPVTLTVDIMTPHMGKWYENGGNISQASYPETLPADWHDPVPVPFLVAKDIKLLFSVAPRAHAKDAPPLNEVMNSLREALKWMGAGAKTAVGYGQMTEFSVDKKALCPPANSSKVKNSGR